ncbi:hypothetical protein PTTG_05280 [Puccinia triticina 1-1 BBBD Race 1]|uniref:Uncharacterized protein n=2 Tax=Puccinia triticina TaxID=208348 RepID=A0A0C4EWT4_PUCT1|nr:uncharacterized protein PtA15_5A877 [Puccinia triticina]OAV91625.1 hypothetical protein PTTG_05280 [Puccinia triticina 1-1 BBBD Race 1]WAQ85302.1 hypothetical protein PtA15_5A877 [Puccinia triticina]WAR58599.1 hypothetical protein PtB15_5B833 [Puccinia triticina]
MSQPNTPQRENTYPLAMPRVLAALKDLIVVEETNEERIKLNNKVAWFHDVFRLKGSTIPHAFKAVIVFTLWSTIVAVADLVYETSLNLSNSVVPLLSVVVGLMLVFRNTTAFARWEDGRKAFTSLQSAVRNTARDYWISIGAPVHTSNPKDPRPAPLSPKEIRLKARALRLLVAYVTAVKRHVRGQYGIDYEDLRALLPPEFYNRSSQPGFGFDAADADIKGSSSNTMPNESPPPLSGALREPSGSSNTLSSDAIEPTLGRRRPAYQRVTSFFFSQKEELGRITADSVGVSDESSPLLRHRPSDQRMEDSSVVVVHNFLSRPSLPLPLVIAHQLHLYITRCKRKGYLEAIGPAGHSRLVASISTMNDLFSSIDGLGMTKIPACYCIHLKQCTTLYLWALPLTLASDLGWALIPFVSIVAFTLVGIEALARECEDPFGVDPSDLPLDYICADLRNEVEHLIAKLGSDPEQDLMI